MQPVDPLVIFSYLAAGYFLHSGFLARRGVGKLRSWFPIKYAAGAPRITFYLNAP
jgi:hypothetical protein